MPRPMPRLPPVTTATRPSRAVVLARAVIGRDNVCTSSAAAGAPIIAADLHNDPGGRAQLGCPPGGTSGGRGDGTPTVRGSADGTGAAASFDFPGSVAVGRDGNLYVTEGFNSTIRKITAAGV